MFTATKKHITDEKMAEHLNGLHISPDYRSHEAPQPSWEETMSIEPEPSTSRGTNSSNNYNINMSPQDLEQRLKNAQRITICEQIRKIQNEPLLPESLLERIERPCTALVLWQPPPKLTNFITDPQSTNEMDDSQEKQNEDDNQLLFSQVNNNNNSSIDLNSSMDLDM